MRSFSRAQIVNVAYYGGGACLVVVSLICLLLGWLTPSIVASVAAAAWLVGGMALMFLFEPALYRWINLG